MVNAEPLIPQMLRVARRICAGGTRPGCAALRAPDDEHSHPVSAKRYKLGIVVGAKRTAPKVGCAGSTGKAYTAFLRAGEVSS